MKREFQMKKLLVIGIMLLSMALLTACSTKKGGASPDELGEAGLSESDLNAQREGRYAGGAIPLGEAEGMFRDIRFSYDSTSIDDQGRQNVEQNVQVLQANPGIRVQLEGHCDERGTAEYNLALGSRRAQAVYDLLVSFGIPSNRIETISYGEEVPLDPAHTEAAWAKNRRVHFTAYTNTAPQRRK